MRIRGLLLGIMLAVAAALSACGRAGAVEGFELWPGDQLVAETQGCVAECQPGTKGQRTCWLKDPECRVVCRTIPDCMPDRVHAIKACATVRAQR